MSNEDLLERAAAEILDSACAIGGRSQTLNTLSTVTGSSCVTVLPLKGRVPGITMSDGAERLAEKYFTDGWHLRDLRNRGLPHLKRHGLVVEQDFISSDEMSGSPYYEAFLRPLGFRFFARLHVKSEGDEWCVAFQRNLAQSYFSKTDQRVLRKLLAPLNLAAKSILLSQGLIRLESRHSISLIFSLIDSAVSTR